MNRSIRIISFILVTALLSGCGLFKRLSLNDTDTTYTSAKKRAIYSKKVTQITPGMIRPTDIVCLEPSPDVASVSQTALGLIADSGKGVKAQISASKAEALASLLERTTTIQLLRDQMFRGCEAYANGAITATSYSLLMSRNNKAMITLMLGETAAGAFGRTGVFLSGKTSSQSSQSAADFSQSFEEALAQLEPIEKSIIAKQGEIKSKDKAIEATNDSEEQVKLSSEKTVLENDLKLLQAQKTNALVLIQTKQNQSAKTAAEIVEAKGFGSLSKTPSEYVVEALSDMQDIYMRDSLADEVISACIVEMGMSSPSYSESAERDLFLHLLDYQKHGDKSKKIKEFNTNMLRRTLLAEYCNNNLFSMVTHAEKNRQTNVRRYYDLQKTKHTQRTVASCDRLDTPEQRTKCFERIGIKLPTTPKKTDSNITKFYEYSDIKKLLKDIRILRPQVKALHEKLEQAAGVNTHNKEITIDQLSKLTNTSDALKTEFLTALNNSHTHELDKKYAEATDGDSDSSIPKLKKSNDDDENGVMEIAIEFLQKVTKKTQEADGGTLTEQQKALLTAEYKVIELKLEYFVEQLSEFKALLENTKVTLTKFNVDKTAV